MIGTMMAWLQPSGQVHEGNHTSLVTTISLVYDWKQDGLLSAIGARGAPLSQKKKKKLGIRNTTGPWRYVQVMDFSVCQRQKLKNRVWMNLFIFLSLQTIY
jgi:hypothetical protein